MIRCRGQRRWYQHSPITVKRQERERTEDMEVSLYSSTRQMNQQARHQHLAYSNDIPRERFSRTKKGERHWKQGQSSAEQQRRPDVNVHLAIRSRPGARRDYHCRNDAGEPLEQHQPCEHPVGALVNRPLTLLKQTLRAFLGRLFHDLFQVLLIHNLSPLDDFGVCRAHPNTGVRFCCAAPSLTNEIMEERPALSPGCPREAVMPPLKSSFPDLSYNIVWPDTWALNKSASVSSRSVITVTSGIAAALRRTSVSSQPSGVPCGRTKTTTP